MFGLFKKKKVTYEMKAVVDGAVVPMTEATDPVFSSCALGNGVVIRPTSDVIVAPADGTVTVTMDGSNNHMYAQIIDDTVGNTLVSASTLQKDVKAELEKTNNVDAAAYLGKVIAEKALEKGIKEVVFDRGGFIYQGKIAALAEAAREAGLEF